MSFAYLLDTSVLSQPLKDRPLRAVQRRWTPERSAGLCTSAICQAELLRGLELRQSEKLWRRYRDYLEGEVAVGGRRGSTPGGVPGCKRRVRAATWRTC